jgi:CrcB protein
VPATPGSWPWATFVANVTGTLLLGYFVTGLQERLLVSAYRRPLLGTGLCGALTTFSTMQLEALRMLTGGRAGLAVAYALTSIAVGFAGGVPGHGAGPADKDAGVTALVWLSVGLLGGVGALGRFLLDAAVSLRLGRQFPVGTLVVNASGAFLLGLLAGLGAAGRTMLLAGTATLGSYTTFSTWMLESHRLGEDGELRLALANLVVSLLVGVAAAAAGWGLGVAL